MAAAEEAVWRAREVEAPRMVVVAAAGAARWPETRVWVRARCQGPGRRGGGPRRAGDGELARAPATAPVRASASTSRRSVIRLSSTASGHSRAAASSSGTVRVDQAAPGGQAVRRPHVGGEHLAAAAGPLADARQRRRRRRSPGANSAG